MNRTKGLLRVLVLLAAASLFFGLLDRWFFLADLICQFRLITAYLLALGGILLLVLRSWKWGSCGILIGITFLILIWPFACPIALKSTSIEPGYQLFSFNVLVSNDQKELVTEEIFSVDPDIVLLFEIDRDWKNHLMVQLSERWPFHKILDREDAFGIAVFSKRQIQSLEFIEVPGVFSTPIVTGLVELDDSKSTVRLIGAHPVPPIDVAHWKARNRLFRGLAEIINSDHATRTIVAGDMNSSPWCYWIRQLKKDASLQFASRFRGIQMTWSPFKFVKLGLPIDHVLTGGDFQVLDLRVGEFIGSDHRPVILRFR